MNFFNAISKIKHLYRMLFMNYQTNNKFSRSIAKAREVLEDNGMDMPPIAVEEIIENLSLIHI